MVKEAEQLKKELEETKKKAEEYLNGWKRVKADYLNREKEIEKEKIDWVKFANLELILQLLTILDSFDEAIKHIPEDLKENDWLKGILQIKQQFENFLTTQGVEKIKTVDEKFNPELHEAVEKKPLPSEAQGAKEEIENIIIEEIEAGYLMHNQVIKPAKVIIK